MNYTTSAPHSSNEAQIKYAELLYVILDTPWTSPIKKLKAMQKAERFAYSHSHCCEWAKEELTP
jgi:hypothetical protein